jgi:hypothetical protein
MKRTPPPVWQNLVAMARRASETGPEVSVPPGFATRVVARAFAPAERGLSGLFDLFAWRALSVASVLAVLVASTTFSPVVRALNDEIAQAEGDPTAEILE